MSILTNLIASFMEDPAKRQAKNDSFIRQDYICGQDRIEQYRHEANMAPRKDKSITTSIFARSPYNQGNVPADGYRM
eukprot:CAMPEP_0175094810 /NCGR_PEP_ID=MMETSP0086_2-20121207/3804_1 /TAXON_ID=136419 /ORGANISM="Unknown Unknown, Strain D1" /LENGTH=76 /DNA_ID=CAMNT_0016367983 /DNA_START=30 /DNA_END=260 /DNA_ORIENTATION=+